MYKILGTIFLIISISDANAQDESSQAYYSAYNICSPYAQNETMRQCNYAKMVEGYYITCMSQNGYKESDETADNNYYAGYLQSHNQCTAIANGAAAKQCNYGVVYNGYYNKCMAGYGFNSNGENIGQSTNNAQKEGIAPPAKQEPKKKGNGFITKFVDSIL